MKVKLTVLLAALIALSTASPVLADTCLTSEQQQTLQQLAENSNISYTSLVSIFEDICAELDEKQTRNEAQLQYEMTKDYVDAKIESSTNITEAVDEKISEINQSVENRLSNFTAEIEKQMNLSRTIQLIAEILNESTAAEKAELLALLDAKADIIKHDLMVEIETIKDNYLSKEEYYAEQKESKKKPAATIVRNYTHTTTTTTSPAPWWRPEPGTLVTIAIIGLIAFELFRRFGKDKFQFGARPERKQNDLDIIRNEIVKAVKSEYERERAKTAGEGDGKGAEPAKRKA